jgi:hypothetical protein
LSLKSTEEHRLRVFENRLMRRIFGFMLEKVTGGWRKLHSKEFHKLYSSRNIFRVSNSRKIRWADM